MDPTTRGVPVRMASTKRTRSDASGRTRTCKPFRALGSEPSAFATFATEAFKRCTREDSNLHTLSGNGSLGRRVYQLRHSCLNSKSVGLESNQSAPKRHGVTARYLHQEASHGYGSLDEGLYIVHVSCVDSPKIGLTGLEPAIPCPPELLWSGFLLGNPRGGVPCR